MGWIVVDPDTGSAGYLIAGVLTSGGRVLAAADVPEGLSIKGGGDTSEPTDTEEFEDCLAKGQVRLNIGCFLAINAAAITVVAPLVIEVIGGAIRFSRGDPRGAGLAISSAALLALVEVLFYNTCQEAAC